jgi:hypothetical protein
LLLLYLPFVLNCTSDRFNNALHSHNVLVQFAAVLSGGLCQSDGDFATRVHNLRSCFDQLSNVLICFGHLLYTRDLDDDLCGLHDQSSSASRVAAGAGGFLILTQQSLRPGVSRDLMGFETMPSQPSAQACP